MRPFFLQINNINAIYFLHGYQYISKKNLFICILTKTCKKKRGGGSFFLFFVLFVFICFFICFLQINNTCFK